MEPIIFNNSTRRPMHSYIWSINPLFITVGWFLDKITVQALNGGPCYVFICQKWLDSKKGDGVVRRGK